MKEYLIQTIKQQGLHLSPLLKINTNMAEHLAQKWIYEPFSLPTWDSPVSMDNNLELASSYYFFGNLMNYGFYTEREFSGPAGDNRLWLRLRSHPEILEVANLINLSEPEFCRVFGPIPNTPDRVKMLRESAQILRRMYNGKVSELYEAHHWSAPEIITVLSKYFPAFQDSPRGIPFYRRAILTLFMTHGRFQDSNLFSKLASLAIGADSQVFNGLLQLGILEIEPELSDTLENGLGSKEIELTVRSISVLAAEVLLQEINRLRKSKIETYHLDYLLRKTGTNGKAPLTLGYSTAF